MMSYTIPGSFHSATLERICLHWNRAILGQLENVVKNIYPEGAMFAGMLGHMPFLLKDN